MEINNFKISLCYVLYRYMVPSPNNISRCMCRCIYTTSFKLYFRSIYTPLLILSLCRSDRASIPHSTGLLSMATLGPSRSSWTGGQTSRPGSRWVSCMCCIIYILLRDTVVSVMYVEYEMVGCCPYPLRCAPILPIDTLQYYMNHNHGNICMYSMYLWDRIPYVYVWDDVLMI